MQSKYPLTPFHVPDDTPVCERVKMINDLANEGEQFPSVQAIAKSVATNAAAQAARFSSLAQSDPDVARVMRTQQWYRRIVAMEALREVQAFPYVHDPKDEEWLQSADYTTKYGGDCKDLTILLVAVERILGLTAEPYWITQTGQTINHVTSRVKLDGKWFWAEPSIRGAMLGESPYSAAERLGAQDVVGGLKANPAGMIAAGERVNPAGKGGGGGGGHGGGGMGGRGGWGGGFGRGGVYPFYWGGWNYYWPGWPAYWWLYNCPYLYSPYQCLLANPTAYGLYPPGYVYGSY